jgi:hypothetical protein
MGAITRLRSVNRSTLRFVAIGLLLTGCSTTSHVLIGKARPPVPVEQVRLYMEPPLKYEQIALIDASSEGSLQFGDQAKIDAALARMKAAAAKLGANGVLYQGSGEKPGAVIGTGGSNVSFGSNSAVGIGIGMSNQLMHKVVHGTAIFVTDPSPAPAPAPAPAPVAPPVTSP